MRLILDAVEQKRLIPPWRGACARPHRLTPAPMTLLTDASSRAQDGGH